MDSVASTTIPGSDGPAAKDAVPNSDLGARTPFTPARIATTARVVFIVLALLAFMYFARAVVLPVLLAWFASMTLKAPMRWLGRCHLPTLLAAAIVVCILLAGVGFSAVYLGRPAVEWLAEAPQSAPRLKDKFQSLLRPAAQLSEAAASVGNLTENTTKNAQPVEVKDNRVANTVFSWTGTLLASAGETVALVFLLLASGDLFLQKLVRAIPRLRDKKRAVEISREIQQGISTYLFSVGLINLGFGIAVGLALHVLGMPNALMWGGVAAFANFIPYIGPILGMIAVGLAGLLAFDTLGRGVLPVSAYFLLHLVETYAVTPFVLGRRFALNPVLIFIMLIFCSWLWGVIGALLSVPLLVTAKVFCDRIPALNFIGDFLSPNDVIEAAQEAKPASPPPVADTAVSINPHVP